jgi:hypothetical protein
MKSNMCVKVEFLAGTHYLSEFIKDVVYIPFQILENEDET